MSKSKMVDLLSEINQKLDILIGKKQEDKREEDMLIAKRIALVEKYGSACYIADAAREMNVTRATVYWRIEQGLLKRHENSKKVSVLSLADLMYPLDALKKERSGEHDATQPDIRIPPEVIEAARRDDAAGAC